MASFQDAGIYVLINLAVWNNAASPSALFIGYNGTEDAPKPFWDGDIWDAFTGLVDELAGFSNLLGFVVGESYSQEFGSARFEEELPLAKAATRDMKAFMAARGHRNIPIGFLGEDSPTDIGLGVSYLNCGNVSESIDFWAVYYPWCGDPGTATNLSSSYGNFGIPVFLGVYECLDEDEDFVEVGQLYTPPMTSVFSGGFYSTWYGMFKPQCDV
jgi:hypothetical protein